MTITNASFRDRVRLSLRNVKDKPSHLPLFSYLGQFVIQTHGFVAEKEHGKMGPAASSSRVMILDSLSNSRNWNMPCQTSIRTISWHVIFRSLQLSLEMM